MNAPTTPIDAAEDPPPRGAFALVADKGHLGPAIVTEDAGSRLTFMRPDGTWQKTAPARLYWRGEATVDGFDALRERFEAATAFAASIDLPALHAALPVEGLPIAGEDLAALAGLPADEGALTALAIAVFDDGLHFKLRDGRFHPERAEAIARAIAKRAERARMKARVDAALPILEDLLMTDAAPARRAIVEAAPAELADLFEALTHVAALGRESPSAPLGEATLSALQALHGPARDRLPPSCQPDARGGALQKQLEELLVTLGVLDPRPNLAPVRAGIARRFDAATLAAAEALAASPPPLPDLDLCHLEAFAIDDPETTEVDDAIALDPDDPYRVHVLVADAGVWIPPGSALDAIARERLTTLYLPDGRIPMLPPCLGEACVSLNEGVVRSALVISATLSAEGYPRHIELRRARVKVTAQLTYDAVEGLLAGADAPHAEQLRHLEALALRHRRWRHRAGAVTFQRPEVNFQLQPDRTLSVKIGQPLSRARLLVSELMVLGCAAAAERAAAEQLPTLFRSQAAPDEPPTPPDPTTGRIDDPIAQNELMRRLKPSLLSTDPRPHWTLGVGAYTQLTSPIRRYADLVVHQQLCSWLATGRPAYSAGELKALIADMGQRHGPIRRADQNARRLFALRWFEQEAGQVFDAIVVRDLGKRYLVELVRLGWQSAVTLRGRRKPGARLRVRVEGVDFDTDTVHLKEAG